MMAAQSIDGTYDHSIVGAGTEGCAFANRLTADGRTRLPFSPVVMFAEKAADMIRSGR